MPISLRGGRAFPRWSTRSRCGWRPPVRMPRGSSDERCGRWPNGGSSPEGKPSRICRRRGASVTVLPIKRFGDPVLREGAKPVDRFDDVLRKLADDMLETMYDAPGVGLAGPQVGVTLRVIVFDDGTGPRKLANPEIHDLEGEQEGEEGCLSIP